MLYMAAGGRVTRVHGPFVKDSEVEKIVEFLKSQGAPEYIEAVTEDPEEEDEGEDGEESQALDPMFDKAVAIIAREGKASTSFIQRHLQIGYNRAARIMEAMERQGMVSAANATGKREIYLREAG
jgi:S-DNA-T family DNA segregation ATPase FtsK/SpoIIIE